MKWLITGYTARGVLTFVAGCNADDAREAKLLIGKLMRENPSTVGTWNRTERLEAVPQSTSGPLTSFAVTREGETEK
jgi:hypothetical protein